MDAWDIWDSPRNIAMLMTRVRFSPAKPNGITLARMAGFKRQGIRVLFAALPEFAEHANGLGTFMPTPVLIPDIVDAVGRLLKSDGQGTGGGDARPTARGRLFSGEPLSAAGSNGWATAQSPCRPFRIAVCSRIKLCSRRDT